MNDIFAPLYETVFGLYDSQFSLIFDTLYDDGGYNMFGLSFILAPLLMWLVFYFLWKSPYGKFWHWLIWLLLTALVVGCGTWGLANNEIFASNNPSLVDAIYDKESGYEQYAKTLPIKYALSNSILTIGIGFLYSLVLKQFSKIQVHLPF